jgi:hypothetical protein
VTTVTVSPAEPREEYERVERLRQLAAEQERAAFEAWQHAYGAHEVAAQESAEARRGYLAARDK